MRKFACTCKHTRYADMQKDPPSCMVCVKCGSTLAEEDKIHKEPTEHECVKYEDVDGRKYTLCVPCFAIRSIEGEGWWWDEERVEEQGDEERAE